MWALLLIATLTAVHALYWSPQGVRGAFMPAVALVAARGVPLVLARRRSQTLEAKQLAWDDEEDKQP